MIEHLKGLFRDLNLENTLVISVQHLCSTTEIFFEALLDLHLVPKNLYVLGKCYSTNPQVLMRLRQRGVQASPASSSFENDLPFDVDFERNIEEMLEDAISSKDLFSYERIIILDDGGHLIEKANSRMPKGLPIIGIEQTSSGFNRTKNQEISFPMINLARASVKLDHETPIIIALMMRKLKERLARLQKTTESILLMGQGVLGREVYETLHDKYCVSTFDLIPERSDISRRSLKEKLKEFDLIIGCTGATSLYFSDFKYLKESVVLASISSSDREFEAAELRKLYPIKECHSDIIGGGVTLLNGGFPITFDEDYDSIDTDDFQLTRALLFASIYQAHTQKENTVGFSPLSEELQTTILQYWTSFLEVCL